MIFFDTHCHTNASFCGKDDMTIEWYRERSVDAAPIVITDHSSHIFSPEKTEELVWWAWRDAPDPVEFFARNKEEGFERLEKYYDRLSRLRGDGVLMGTEVDVIPDGTVIFPETLLKRMDFVIGAIHGVRGLREMPGGFYDESAVFANYRLRASALLDAGVNSVAHPFLEWKIHNKKRDALPKLLDWLVDAAKDAGAALEVNSHNPFPEMDLPMIRKSIEKGVKLSIATDTHSKSEFGDFTYHVEILKLAGIRESDYDDILLTKSLNR